MKTIHDAWEWYNFTRDNLIRFRRLADKHWNDLPWEGHLGKDETFKNLDSIDVTRESDLGLTHFDDIAVLVLFSVFEAEVRQTVMTDVNSESFDIQHPTVKYAITKALETIESGSFYRVLEPYKKSTLVELIEPVNQVRRYRNWVAHGKRSEQPADVTPKVAYERLNQFLVAFNEPKTRFEFEKRE